MKIGSFDSLHHHIVEIFCSSHDWTPLSLSLCLSLFRVCETKGKAHSNGRRSHFEIGGDDSDSSCSHFDPTPPISSYPQQLHDPTLHLCCHFLHFLSPHGFLILGWFSNLGWFFDLGLVVGSKREIRVVMMMVVGSKRERQWRK